MVATPDTGLVEWLKSFAQMNELGMILGDDTTKSNLLP